MYHTTNIATFVILATLTAAKYSPDSYSGGSSGASGAKQKLPVILMHKQALAEDGGFNFAFAGDNGIKHGETIRPDGTRTGAYSYVDPNGETISVKYTAGKGGFQILHGDHIPRAPFASPSLQGAASSHRYTQPLIATNSLSLPSMPAIKGAASDEFADTPDYAFGPIGSYSQYRSKINPNFKAVYRVHEGNSDENYSQAVPRSRTRYEHEENSKRPHSFGNGYSFEFGQSQ